MVQAKDPCYGVLFEGVLFGVQQSVEEIRAIVEAIEARDGEAAAEAASNHVRQAARVLFRTYARSIPAAEGLVS